MRELQGQEFYDFSKRRSRAYVESVRSEGRLEVTGEVRLPRAHVQPFIELLRSVPGGSDPILGVNFDVDGVHYQLEVVRRGMPDRLGNHGQATARCSSFRGAAQQRGPSRRMSLLAALDLRDLLARAEGAPLHITTPAGEMTIEGDVMDTVIRRLRPKLLNARHPEVS